MKVVRFVVVLIPLLAVACSGNSTNPSSTPTTSSTAANTPAGYQTFSGSLNVGESVFITFPISTAGIVNVTLVSVSTALTAPSAGTVLGLGLGAAAADGSCTVTSSTTTTAGLTNQLSGQGAVGTGCVEISDVGQLTGRVTFAVRVAHS
jgi:hypothetical protein